MGRRYSVALAAALCVIIAAIAASAAAAAGTNTLGPPPWTGSLCPAIGLDTGCQYGIDVTAVDSTTGAATKQTIAEDGDQGPYDDDEDAMVVIKNDSTTAMQTIKMGIANSDQQLFAFDGDGLCTGTANGTVTWTPPAGCPFNVSPNPSSYTVTGYEGPQTWFDYDVSGDVGTIHFNPALAPGATTYFSLETNPDVVPTAGSVNNWLTSVMTAPGQSQTSSYVAVSTGVNITDQATVNGQYGAVNGAVTGDGSAAGTVVYTLYANDNSCSTTPVYTSGPKAVTAGVAAPSDPVGASLAAGRYYWLESFTPTDAHNTPTQSICGQEILGIGSTGVVTKLSSTSVLPNAPVSDTATLQGVKVAKAVTGTFSFAIYTDKACTVPYSATPFGLTGITPTNGSASTGPLALPSGIYYFQASYGGDSKNGAGKSVCGSEILRVSNSAFTIVKKPKVGKKYKITFTVQVFDPGRLKWNFSAQNKKGLLAAADVLAVTAKKCGKGKVKISGKCEPATVTFGSGSKSLTAGALVTSHGLLTVTVSPRAKLRSALNKGKKIKLTGALSYQSLFGLTPVTHIVTVTVHGKKPHKKKKKKKNKK